MLFARQFISAFIMGMILLLVDVVGDRLEADEIAKLVIAIALFILIHSSISIIRLGGVLVLCKILAGIILFFTLIFLPVTLYNMWRR